MLIGEPVAHWLPRPNGVLVMRSVLFPPASVRIVRNSGDWQPRLADDVDDCWQAHVTLAQQVSNIMGGSGRDDLVRLMGQGFPWASPIEVANRCNSKRTTCPVTFSPRGNARQLSLPELEVLVAQLPDPRRAVLGELGPASPRLSFWVTGMRQNLDELPGVIDLAAHLGVDEVYLQRMVFGFDTEALANEAQSIYAGYRDEAEAIIADAEHRARAHRVSFRRADGLRPPQTEPWGACSQPLRPAYITGQGNGLPCCIARFADAPKQGNHLRDGVQAVWTGEAYREFRERLYSTDPSASCRNCGLAWTP